jgi:hypothetical protein
VGCQRSGTTLTGQVLGAHANAILIDEFEGLYPWFHSFADNKVDAQELTSAVLSKSTAKYRDPDQRFLHEHGDITLAQNIDTIVLKAPNLTYYFEKIATLDCSVRIVYPVRDPRAVISSMQRLSNITFVENQLELIKKTPWIISQFQDAFEILEDDQQPHWKRAAIVWKIKSGLAEQFSNQGLPVFQFLYEDMVRSPDHWIGKLLSFCGLPDSQTPRKHHTVYQGTGPGGTVRDRALDVKAVSSWKDELESDVASRILTTAQPLAGGLGYA